MAARVAPARRRPRLAAGTAWPWLALAGLLAAGFALVLYLGRDTSFWYDEWDFVLDRRAWDADALLLPHNEHLSVAPVVAYKLIFATAGIESYVPFRVWGALVHVVVCATLFLYARRRVGDLLALGAATVVLFLGPAWPDVLWPFQSGYLGSLACGIGALLALDRGDRRGEVAAAVLLALSIAFSSMGLPIFAAAALEVLGRPDRARRWWVIAAPAALYALWYLGYSGDSRMTVDNLLETPAYVVEAAAGALGAVFGLGSEWGRPLTLAAIAALVLALRRGAADPWRLAALIAMPLLFWALTGLSRADLNEPAAPRYLYPGAVFLLLIAVEAARGVRVSRPATAALAVVLIGVTISNLGALRNGGGFLRDRTADLDGALAALAVAAPRGVPDDFVPEPNVAPQIQAGAYLDAVEDLGSPAPAPAALPGLLQRSRASADATLTRLYGVALAFAPGRPAGSAPPAERATGAAVTPRGACLRARPQAPGGTVELAVPAGGLLLDSDGGGAKVAVRRFSDVFPEAAVGDVAAGRDPVALRLPADASTAPWHARLTLTGPVRACALGA